MVESIALLLIRTQPRNFALPGTLDALRVFEIDQFFDQGFFDLLLSHG